MERVLDEPWYSNEFFWSSPVTYKETAEKAIAFIRDRFVGRCEFKIGITEDPGGRWWRTDCGYHLPGNDFRQMHVLYAAPTSKHKIHPCDSESRKELKRESTGAMEKLFIAEFENSDGCLNRPGAGGECPSEGPPHFLYIASR